MNKLDASAQGVYLITVTPFTDSGDLDLASTDRMVDFCLDSGVAGLTILGIMGEATKLTADESHLFVKQVLGRVAGRVPVVVGASAPGFAPMRELTQSVMAMGAAGVMVAPPSTLRTDDQIVAYFEMVNETLGPAGSPGIHGGADVDTGNFAHSHEFTGMCHAQARGLPRFSQIVRHLRRNQAGQCHANFDLDG